MTGIILAGGKSSRMGQDKAFMLFSGKPLIENLIKEMGILFDDTIIVTNTPSAYRNYAVRIETDIIKNKGPLGGIYTGLARSHNTHNFVTACDMPFLRQDVVRYMLDESSGYDVVVLKHKRRIEPLCAVYSKNCIRPIENQLYQNNLKITDFFQHVKTKVITDRQITRLDPEGMCLININTAEDYERFKC